MHQHLFEFIRELYQTKDFIPLHAPRFVGQESAYVQHTLDSTFVSSVGAYVDRFEADLASYCKVSKAVAVMNGTAALQAALYAAGVINNDLVVTQSFTFVATCNAIHWSGAEPVFVDVSELSLGLCPKSLADFLQQQCELTEKGCIHIKSQRRVRAVVPMHTFGHPVQLDELMLLCQQWQLVLVEDAAESLGSLYKGRHTGTFGRFGTLSFNGNKIITTGGGGMVLCADANDGMALKHLTTTAKIPHSYEFVHDDYGFNYRMPNLNAALGCGQLEQLDGFIADKREIAALYQDFFAGSEFRCIKEPTYARSNYWLNAVICPSAEVKTQWLESAAEQGIMLRPAWRPMHQLAIYQHCIRTKLAVTEHLAEHLVNLPSSVRETL
ncbi:aminotransferase DegT [Rheinheimera sp. SA_1]|uniref:LegC family aminotransferase n=1 Tax=Rheinheimera sp. SA_1 TaxID=1827365 RepID=UPI000801ADB2|nr:LegC family aminotransferase [Rheinheimera sp. SA_1]OBP15406.1 aminotransferase DegT [Rheinheimera sp. SA_1]